MNATRPRLRDEIAAGNLCLKADELSRFRFAVEIDGDQVGCYAVRSLGPHKIRLERAWNRVGGSFDPRTEMWRLGLLAKKFLRIRPDSHVKIIEFFGFGGRVDDAVVLQASRVEFSDGPDVKDVSDGACLKFECVDLLGVTFCAD